MPGLQRISDRHHDAAEHDFSNEREAELKMRLKPSGVKREASVSHVVQHILKVLANKVGQQKTVMQFGAPTAGMGQIRFIPKARHHGPDEELLQSTHACVRRHLKGPKFQ